MGFRCMLTFPVNASMEERDGSGGSQEPCGANPALDSHDIPMGYRAALPPPLRTLSRISRYVPSV